MTGKEGAWKVNGKVNLSIDGGKAVEGQVDKTHANTFSLDDSAGTGIDTETAVDSAYSEGTENAFSGRLTQVKISLRTP
jgi:arylsulfatase